jgi:HEAT repeat protein
MKKVSIVLFMTFLFLPGGKATGDLIDGIIKDLHSHNRQTQLSAVEELEGIEGREAVDALLNFVFERAEDWQVKIRAIRVLGEIRDPDVADKLVTIFNNPFLNEECPAIKLNTALALGKEKNKGTRAVDSLIDALDYDSLPVREAVIQSLGKMGDSRAVPFLIPVLYDRSFAIRLSTVKALEEIGNPQAIPFLKQVADMDHDPYIKEAAVTALRNFTAD